MKDRLLFVAPFLLCGSILSAQQGPPATQDQGYSANRPHRPDADHAGGERRFDDHEQMHEVMQDLDELGLPPGQFWLNPDIASMISLTPDQVHRLADAYLQGRLKLIQLDAAVQTEEAKLEPMLAAPVIDNERAQAQTDRIADARAALDKADAHMAFALRAILTPQQLGMMRTGSQGRAGSGSGQAQ